MEKSAMFYVYMLLDPRNDNRPFYVGKGSDERWKDHLFEDIDSTINKRKFYTIQAIRNQGLDVGVKIVQEFDDEQEAYDFETSLIRLYGRKGYELDGTLTNICIDAKPPRYWEGPNAEEILKKIQESRKQNPYKHPQEIRDKISAKCKGKSKKPRSVEHRAALSNALKGKPLSRICTEETRLKRSINQTGKTASEETKSKISQKLKERVMTAEHKEKIRMAMLARRKKE